MDLEKALSSFTKQNEKQFGQILFHILPAKDWEEAQAAGVYAPASMETDGFIHCSTAAQVQGTLDNFYGGQKGLLLLCIAALKVTAEIRFEDLYEAGQDFPHIYGPLNLDAVVEVLDIDEYQTKD